MCIGVDAIGSPTELPIDDDTLVEVEIDDRYCISSTPAPWATSPRARRWN